MSGRSGRWLVCAVPAILFACGGDEGSGDESVAGGGHAGEVSEQAGTDTSQGGSGEEPPSCDPGTTRACTGASQCDGLQSCRSDGSGFGACQCQDETGGAAGETGVGGRSVGGTASGGRSNGGTAGRGVGGAAASGGRGGAGDGGSVSGGAAGSPQAGTPGDGGALLAGMAGDLGAGGTFGGTAGTAPSQGGGTAGDMSVGGQGQAGAAGSLGTECSGSDQRPCYLGGLLGDCSQGTQRCTAQGEYQESCSIAPAEQDSCQPGHDEDCDGTPNEGCPCDEGALQACGPSANLGICRRGVSTCTDGQWGPCEDAVYPGLRDCTSTEDRDCDGQPDNTHESCRCQLGETVDCEAHEGFDGVGVCRAGTSSCELPGDGSSSSFGACEDAVGPTREVCAEDGLDEDCDGQVNEAESCDRVPCRTISAGVFHTCAVMDDDTVRCWGINTSHLLGNSQVPEEGSTTPVVATSLVNVEHVEAGTWNNCVVYRDGGAHCWGYDGQEDDWNISSGVDFHPEGVLLADVQPSVDHTCSLSTTDGVYCWGSGEDGRLGQSTPLYDQSEPSGVRFATSHTGTATAIGIGTAFGCMLMDEQTVWCWGDNSTGACGTGSGLDEEVNVTQVTAIDDAVAIAVGSWHACVLHADSTVSCWGNNETGQLGDGTRDDQPTPTTVLGLTGVTQLSAGGDVTCAVMLDKTVQCWGKLPGVYTGEYELNPVPIDGLENVEVLSCGSSHCCVVESDGSAWCWGLNGDGQLGNGSTENTPTPVRVAFP